MKGRPDGYGKTDYLMNIISKTTASSRKLMLKLT